MARWITQQESSSGSSPCTICRLTLAAWRLGRAGALIVALLATSVWAAGNFFGGLHFSNNFVWPFNILAQGTSFVVIGLLIAHVRQALATVNALSRIDSLTLLHNSRSFHEHLEYTLELSRRYGHPITIAYIDLDNFKMVNDTLGHRAGDQLLSKVGETLNRGARAGDITARLGGDEFALILPETGPDGARVVLNRLHTTLREALSGLDVPVSASIGATTFLEPNGTAQSLIAAADSRMYAAKSAGRDRVCLEVVS